jgi:hypothetical protein
LRIGEYIQERRLLQRNGERRLQRVVKYRASGLVPRRIAILCDEHSGDLAIKAGDLSRTLVRSSGLGLSHPAFPALKAIGMLPFSGWNPNASLNCESAAALANGQDASNFKTDFSTVARLCKVLFPPKAKPSNGIYCRGFGKDT